MGKKFPDFKFFAGEGFDRAHTGKVFLGYRIEGGVFLADGLINGVQFPLHYDGDQSGGEHGGRRDQCKAGVQAVHAEENDRSMYDHFDHQHSDESDAVADAVDIIFDTRHQFTRVRPVKEIRA